MQSRTAAASRGRLVVAALVLTCVLLPTAILLVTPRPVVELAGTTEPVASETSDHLATEAPTGWLAGVVDDHHQGGEPVLTLNTTASRATTAAGESLTFTAAPGGVGGPSAIVGWAFSDESTAFGESVIHVFTSPGPAWARAIAVDPNGTESSPSWINFTVLPALQVTLVANQTSGPAPLPLGLEAIVTGGSGAYPSSSINGSGAWTGTLQGQQVDVTLTNVGAATFVATVNDSVGDQATSLPLIVNVSAPVPADPTVTLTTDGPASALVTWSAPSTLAYQGTKVWVSTDGGAPALVANLNDQASFSYALTNLTLASRLNVTVELDTSYDTHTNSTPVSYTVPLVAPILSVTPDPQLPGQGDLSWTLPTVDHLTQDWLCVLPPGEETTSSSSASCGQGEMISLSTSATVRSGITPVLPDMATSYVALIVTTSTAGTVLSSWVPFTPTFAPPSLTASIHVETANLSWTPPDLPGLVSWAVCWTRSGSSTTTCAANSTDTSVTSTSLTFPTAGTFDLRVVFTSSNGFVLTSSEAQVVAHGLGPAVPWYEAALGPAQVQVWLALSLLVLLLALMIVVYWRERTEIPPFLGLPLPWDPLAPEPSARKRKQAREEETPIHVHRQSHSHRHGEAHHDERHPPKAVRLGSGRSPTRPHRTVSEEADDEEGEAAPPKPKETRPSGKKEPAEEEEDEDEPRVSPPHRSESHPTVRHSDESPHAATKKDGEDDDKDEDEDDDEKEAPAKAPREAGPEKPLPRSAPKSGKDEPATKPKPKGPEGPDDPTL